MSGSPKNIQRDAIWINPDTTDDIAFPNATAMSATNLGANAPTAVNTDYGCVQANNAAITVAVDNQETIGVYMQPPDGDNTPYRVKASAFVLGQADYSEWWSIVVGYAPATITGSNDTIEDVYYIPFTNEFDDLIMVPTLVSGDTYYGRALFIGVCIHAPLVITTLRARAQISVQRLATKPPTMNNAVS